MKRYTNNELAAKIDSQGAIMLSFQKEIRNEIKDMREDIKPLNKFMIERQYAERQEARKPTAPDWIDGVKQVGVGIGVIVGVVALAIQAFNQVVSP